jgi:hypothetical protein
LLLDIERISIFTFYMTVKIGLLSDTHGHLDPKVFEYFNSCDEIWHAGDIGTIALYDELNAFKPVKAVYGNIDGQDIRTVCKETIMFRCERVKVMMTHIGGYPPKYNRQIFSKLLAHPPDLFICGHSHILKIMKDPRLNNLLYINPGAAGIHGFHHTRTLVRFEIDDTQVKNMQVIELGPRAKKKQGQ